MDRRLTGLVLLGMIASQSGCGRLPGARSLLPLNQTAQMMMPSAPTLPPQWIPRQGYLEQGYSATTAPILYTHEQHGVRPAQYVPTATPLEGGSGYGPNYGPSPNGYARTPLAARHPAPMPTGSLGGDYSVELLRNLEELHGKYNLVLEELSALRREVAANSEAIGHASQQIEATGEGVKNVRSTMISWRKALDGLEQRVKTDRETQMGMLDEVESLLMNILASEERHQK